MRTAKVTHEKINSYFNSNLLEIRKLYRKEQLERMKTSLELGQ